MQAHCARHPLNPRAFMCTTCVTLQQLHKQWCFHHPCCIVKKLRQSYIRRRLAQVPAVSSWVTLKWIISGYLVLKSAVLPWQ